MTGKGTGVPKKIMLKPWRWRLDAFEPQDEVTTRGRPLLLRPAMPALNKGSATRGLP
jgi:hypothetical protein